MAPHYPGAVRRAAVHPHPLESSAGALSYRRRGVYTATTLQLHCGGLHLCLRTTGRKAPYTKETTPHRPVLLVAQWCSCTGPEHFAHGGYLGAQVPGLGGTGAWTWGHRCLDLRVTLVPRALEHPRVLEALWSGVLQEDDVSWARQSVRLSGWPGTGEAQGVHLDPG